MNFNTLPAEETSTSPKPSIPNFRGRHFARVMKAASSFRPWSERAPVLGAPIAVSQQQLPNPPPYLGESTFPALDDLSTPSLRCQEMKRGLLISRDGVVQISAAPAPLESDHDLAVALCGLLIAQGIPVEVSTGEGASWPQYALVIGRVSTHPALSHHYKNSLFGHPDETLPDRGEGYISYRMAVGEVGLLGPIASAGGKMATATAMRLVSLIQERDGEYFLPPTHEILRSGGAPCRLTWAELFESWKERARHPLDPMCSSAPPEEMAGHLAKTLEAGTEEESFYNGLYFSWLCEASRFFAQTGAPEALRFFRAGLREIRHYLLASESSPSCPSDFNFYIGSLIHEYARWELLPCFSDVERREHRAVLLGLARMVYRYHCAYYYGNPGLSAIPDVPRHNHQTFPARELYLAARYFSMLGIADTEAWFAKAGEIFETRKFHRIKQQENANLYEWLAYDHAAAYSLMEYGDLRIFGSEGLHVVAKRQLQTVDNEVRPVDFGDSDVILRPYEGALSLLRAQVAAGGNDKEVAMLAWGDRLVEKYVESPIWSLTGGRRSYARQLAINEARWEVAPLEPRMLRGQDNRVRQNATFDKAVFRSGWNPNDLYCCIEGFGNATIPHAHNSLLALERLTLGGCIWLISNGYGKPCGEFNSLKAFRGRELGPQDHNVLVVAGKPLTLPLFAERAMTSDDPRSFMAVARCEHYEWSRTVNICSDRKVEVIDRVHGLKAAAAWIEWNLLGTGQQLKPEEWRMTQDVCRLSVIFCGDHQAITSQLQENKEWHSALLRSSYSRWQGAPLCLRLHLDPSRDTHTVVSTFYHD